MEINCDRCEMRGAGCRDCVITVLQPQNPALDQDHLTDEEVRALGVLADAGLVPPLRLSLPAPSRSGPAVRRGARTWSRRAFPETRAS